MVKEQGFVGGSGLSVAEGWVRNRDTREGKNCSGASARTHPQFHYRQSSA